MRPYHLRLAPLSVFFGRMGRAVGVAVVVLAGTLVIGVLGYHGLAGLSWIDSLLNPSMILGGMGPVDHLSTTGAKPFASFDAIFCGLMLIGAMGLIISPIVHRMLHRFHIDEQDLNGR